VSKNLRVRCVTLSYCTLVDAPVDLVVKSGMTKNRRAKRITTVVRKLRRAISRGNPELAAVLFIVLLAVAAR
jgi:hypothetical protein